MAAVRPLPRTGSVFLDARGDQRALRVSWHDEADLMVVSIWRENVCAATFRLAADDVPDLIDSLVDAMRQRGASQSMRHANAV
ncbi:hypothetical protein F0U44_06790 [Nocardioides humilatus]|uniref:Uncharacterized protein n=1 Tax=Nocardioides humilatus TaxID=2607660 RepID=A0A5B1LQJ6_9ACTN|nr:hypothetical protein [Nocardioides humilatus]KAA1421959.1 hypothetical protein F0U44_06790 [Nocardioides humilatus]